MSEPVPFTDYDTRLAAYAVVRELREETGYDAAIGFWRECRTRA